MLHDLEALCIRLHQAVLDPVVHHLHEVAGTGRADVRIPLFRCERLEDRLESRHRLLVASHHETEADLETPDTTGDAGVDEVDPAVARLHVAPLRVSEVRVAAVDDRVALVRDLEQLVEGLLCDLARRNHHPEGARGLQLLLELLERIGRPRGDVGVIRVQLVAVLTEALRHAGPHAPEPDHPQLHYRSSSLTRTIGRPRSRSSSRGPSGSSCGSSPDSSTSFVLSFAACTSGWSKGLIWRIDPATATANSQRKNSAPISSGSASRTSAAWRSGPSDLSPGAGTSPFPCLPVDSAISCSAHSPKLPSVSPMQTLSRPSRQRSPSWRPSWKPGLASPRQAAAIRSPLSSTRSMSIPIRAAGTMPNGDSAE